MTIRLFPRTLSLSCRLMGFMSLTAIAAFLTFSVIMIYSVEKHFEEQDINDLKAYSASISGHISSRGKNSDGIVGALTKSEFEKSNLFIYLQDEAGKTLFTSDDSPAIDDVIDDGQSGPLYEKNHYRALVSPISVYVDGRPVSYTLIVAMSTDFHLHYIYRLKSDLVVAALVICLIIVLVVQLAVYQGHSPLRKVSKKVASITSDNLNTRLMPEDVPVELRQLVVSFNVMLERIEDVFKRQSNFSADIAHEMRTPITNLVTQTQFILNHPRSTQEYQELLYSNLEEYERMANMVGDMLFLSQVDNHQVVTDTGSVNLRTEIEKVFDFFEAWAEEKGVQLDLKGDVPTIRGDAPMLRRAVSNLLSNAIRYTPIGETVTVALSQMGAEVSLSISNPGVGIPAEHLPHLFDRFYRVDRSRQRKGEGSGIGLAIVKSIVEAHRGRVSVSSDEQITRFSLIFPKE